MTDLMRRNLAGSWPLDALRLGAVMAALALLLGVAVRLTLDPAPSRFALDVERDFRPALLAFSLLVFAPLAETLLLAMLHWLLRARLGASLTVWVCVSAILFALAHAGTNRVPLPQSAAFLLMSYQYALVRDRCGAGIAFTAVVLSHTTYNALVLASVVVFGFLG